MQRASPTPTGFSFWDTIRLVKCLIAKMMLLTNWKMVRQVPMGNNMFITNDVAQF